MVYTVMKCHMEKMQKAKIMVPLAVVALVAGLGASAVSAFAQTATGDTSSSSTAAPAVTRSAFDPSKGGHVGTNGTTEVLLTGDTAAKVSAAALVAVPGGTIERVETDAEGAAYEAHMTAADGSPVTVKFDSSFAVTATEKGPTRGPRQ